MSHDVELQQFLERQGLSKYYALFHERQLSFLGVKLSEEGDLVEAGIPKSVERKVLAAIQEDNNNKQQKQRVVGVQEDKSDSNNEVLLIVCNVCGCESEGDECVDCGSERDGTEDTKLGTTSTSKSATAVVAAPSPVVTHHSGSTYECDVCAAETPADAECCDVCGEPNPAAPQKRNNVKTSSSNNDNKEAAQFVGRQSSSLDENDGVDEEHLSQLQLKLEQLEEEKKRTLLELERIEDLEREHDRLDMRLIQIEAEVDVARETREEDAREKDEVIKELEQSTKNKQNQLDTVRDSVQQMTAFVDTLRNELALIEGEGGNTEESLRAKLSGLTSERQERNHKNNELIERLETRNLALSSARGLMQLMAELQEKRAEQEQEASDRAKGLRQEISVLSEEAEGMQASNQQMREAMTSAMSQEGVSVSDLLALKDLQNRRQQLYQLIERLKSDTEKETAENGELVSKLEEKVTKVGTLSARLEPLIPELAILEKNNVALEETWKRKQAEGMTPEMTAFVAKARAASARFDESDPVVKDLKQGLDKVTSERDGLLADIEKLERDAADRRKRHEQDILEETKRRDGLQERDEKALSVKDQFHSVLKAAGIDVTQFQSPLLAASEWEKQAKNTEKEIMLLEASTKEMEPVIAEMNDTIKATEAKNAKKLKKGARKLEEKTTQLAQFNLDLREEQKRFNVLSQKMAKVKVKVK